MANWSREIGPGGLFVVDVWNVAALLARWSPSFRLEALPLVVDHQQRWDPDTHRLAIHYTYHSEGTAPREYDASFRLYTRRELTALFKSVGFGEVQCFGSLTGEPYTNRSGRLILVARRTV